MPIVVFPHYVTHKQKWSPQEITVLNLEESSMTKNCGLGFALASTP